MRTLRLSLALPLVLAASGCTMTGNPMLREGTWHPTDANAANLAAMVANPHDLVEGRTIQDTPGPLAVLPVERLRSDKVKQLPTNSLVDLGGTNTNSSGGSGGGASSGSGY